MPAEGRNVRPAAAAGPPTPVDSDDHPPDSEGHRSPAGERPSAPADNGLCPSTPPADNGLCFRSTSTGADVQETSPDVVVGLSPPPYRFPPLPPMLLLLRRQLNRF
ncbi:hypothetical protein BDQ12DRAFT_725508 [Crucibulum laeve]|uniref:Uncharacterized protein n=1 Tax=Crucibulum laeve TaxID=68775 RepID=A0A5C3LU98_9AGAR|nr:hypothetical protein BDQ12DRAFT_725508 [Crucibulum laeve]